MVKLTMESSFKKGKYAHKRVSDLVKIKGKIFQMLKEGYEFDDEVLAAAHIIKRERDVKVESRVGGELRMNAMKSLPIETASVKQIISELNTITLAKGKEDVEEMDGDYNNFNSDTDGEE